MKRIISLILAFVMIPSLYGCNKSCKHKDRDGDQTCDKCDAMLDTGDGTTAADDECKHEFLPATCTADGFCTLCGAVGDKATGHIRGDLVLNLPALCEISGEMICPCAVCEEVLAVEEISPLGHDWADGFCSRCGEPQAA